MGRKKKAQVESKGTKLTVDMVVENEKQYEETKRVTFDDGNYVDIYKKFNPIKIEQTIIDHSELISELAERKIDIDNKRIVDLYILYVVLNFSTLGESLPTDPETRIRVFNYLCDSDYVNKIYTSFDQKEAKKAVDALSDRLKLVTDMMSTDEKFRKQVEDKIKEMNEGEVDGV